MCFKSTIITCLKIKLLMRSLETIVTRNLLRWWHILLTNLSTQNSQKIISLIFQFFCLFLLFLLKALVFSYLRDTNFSTLNLMKFCLVKQKICGTILTFNAYIKYSLGVLNFYTKDIIYDKNWRTSLFAPNNIVKRCRNLSSYFRWRLVWLCDSKRTNF